MTDDDLSYDDQSDDNRYGFARRADVLDNPAAEEETLRLEGWQRPDGQGSAVPGRERTGSMSDGEDNEQKLWFALGLAGLVYLVGIISSWSFYARLAMVQ